MLLHDSSVIAGFSVDPFRLYSFNKAMRLLVNATGKKGWISGKGHMRTYNKENKDNDTVALTEFFKSFVKRMMKPCKNLKKKCWQILSQYIDLSRRLVLTTPIIGTDLLRWFSSHTVADIDYGVRNYD